MASALLYSVLHLCLVCYECVHIDYFTVEMIGIRLLSSSLLEEKPKTFHNHREEMKSDILCHFSVMSYFDPKAISSVCLCMQRGVFSDSIGKQR